MGEISILSHQPTEFFRDLVQTAMRAQRVETPEDLEFYLVHLLENHVRTGEQFLEKPLGVTYLEAAAGAPRHRFARFRQVGDTSLFLAGLFSECFERGLVGSAFYVELGRLAYWRTAEHGGSQLRGMFAAMAERFSELVRVLGEISTHDLFTSDQDTVRVYRRWLLSRGAADQSLLVQRGVIPGEPSPSGVRH